jgi:hypothetical protein
MHTQFWSRNYKENDNLGYVSVYSKILVHAINMNIVKIYKFYLKYLCRV